MDIYFTETSRVLSAPGHRRDAASQRRRKRSEITVLVSEQNHFRCGFRADARAILYQWCRDSLIY